jgi:xylulokinase
MLNETNIHRRHSLPLNSLDDKLFSFWLLQGDSFPLSHVKGIYRFETGVKVNEFRDLRANPRCLIESQVLSFRVRWSRMFATGVLGPAAGRTGKSGMTSNPGASSQQASSLSSLGLPFDAYDSSTLPSKVIVTGAAVNCPAIANLAGDILNAPIYMPTTQIDSAQLSPHRNAPAGGYPGRAALGGAYMARWVWGREKGVQVGTGRGFEEEVKRLLGKRWVSAGAMPQKTNVNGTPSVSAIAGASSGTSTPYGKSGLSLGSSILVEEEEEDVAAMEDQMGRTNNYGLGFAEDQIGTAARLRASARSPGGLGSNTNGASTPNTPTAPTTTTLVPVAAMPTAEPELQLGLAKVAEPDVDSFMAYAALVPEYCRLESTLIKSLV